MIELIYIGSRFYNESKTFMSSIYTVDGDRYNYDKIKCALCQGEEVHLRPATSEESAFYEKELKEFKSMWTRA